MMYTLIKNEQTNKQKKKPPQKLEDKPRDEKKQAL